MKAGVITKNEDGSARVNPDAFIGKKAKLLIANKKSKQGKDYPVVSSMSPCKVKQAIPTDEVPWFMVDDKDILYVKLADGIAVRQKKENETNPQAPAQQVNPTQFVAPAPAQPQPQAQPQFQNNAMWPAAATPATPNPTQAVPVVNDDEDLPF